MANILSPFFKSLLKILTPFLLYLFLSFSSLFLFFQSLFFFPKAFGSWMCQETSSYQSGNIFYSCGVGQGKTLQEARTRALREAEKEFYSLCQQSYHCKGKEVVVRPLRTDCQREPQEPQESNDKENNFRCFRGLEFQITSIDQKQASPDMVNLQDLQQKIHAKEKELIALEIQLNKIRYLQRLNADIRDLQDLQNSQTSQPHPEFQNLKKFNLIFFPYLQTGVLWGQVEPFLSLQLRGGYQLFNWISLQGFGSFGPSAYYDLGLSSSLNLFHSLYLRPEWGLGKGSSQRPLVQRGPNLREDSRSRQEEASEAFLGLTTGLSFKGNHPGVDFLSEIGIRFKKNETGILLGFGVNWAP